MPQRNRPRRVEWLLIAFGCALIFGRPTFGEPPKDASNATTHEPKFDRMEVAVVIIGYQGKKLPEGKGTSGCSTSFRPKVSDDPKADHELTCGFPGEVSRVRWWYTHTDKDGDHYEFARQFPFEDVDKQTPKKQVAFQGEPVLVYEDDSHRIYLRVQNPKDRS